MSNLLRSINKIIIALILVTTVTVTVTAYARWLQPGESDLIFDYMNVDITVNSDESSVTEEFQATVITTQGKKATIEWRRNYNSSYQTLEILDAYTILGSKKYKVPNEFVKDKTFFYSHSTLTITFPKAETGAKIYLKLRCNSKHPIKNHFSEIIDFTGDTEFTSKEYKEYSCNINSSMPVYVNINDPNNRLELIQINKTEHGRYLTQIKSIKSITPVSQDEVYKNHSLLGEYAKTMFSISTDSLWEDVGKKLTRNYFKVIDQPLPTKLKDIVDAAKKYTNSVEQINFVTAKLKDMLSVKYDGGRPVNFFEECTTVNCKFIPRDLIRIVEIGAVDSKDFVVATAAVLTQLQYEVFPVLVPNCGLADISQVKVPNMIGIGKLLGSGTALKVIDSNGKSYWLEPKDNMSKAESIPISMYGSMVLVLGPNSATYEKVPEIDPGHSQVIINTIVTWKSNNNINYNGSAILKGYDAIKFTKEDILFFISGKRLDNLNKINIVIPDLTPRIAQEYNIGYEHEYEDDMSTLVTNLGYGLPLPQSKFATDIYQRVVAAVPDQVGDLYIGLPCTICHHMVIKDQVLKSIDKLNYIIDTPWIYIEQSCRQVGNDSEIVYKLIIRKHVISNLELQGAMYKKLKKDIECFVSNACVILEKSKNS